MLLPWNTALQAPDLRVLCGSNVVCFMCVHGYCDMCVSQTSGGVSSYCRYMTSPPGPVRPPTPHPTPPPDPTPKPPGPIPTPAPTPPPPTPPPVNILPPPPACAQGVQFTDAPDSYKHLRAVTFSVMPTHQWGTARGCTFAGHDRVCPVYLSTRTYLNPTKGKLYLSLWKDAEAGRNQGSWVITWAHC